MALGTRNRIPAEITEASKGPAAALVSMRAGEAAFTALITRETPTSRAWRRARG